MRLICVSIFLIFSMALMPWLAADDGWWNGKAWDQSELEDRLEKGDPAAMVEWAQWSMYSWGGVAYQPDEIVRKLEVAHKHGDELATAFLARCYWRGIGVKRDAERAVELCYQSAFNEQAYALYLMSEMYTSRLAETKKVQFSPELAAEWLDIAIDADVVHAKVREACNIYYGLGGYKQDKQKGAETMIDLFLQHHTLWVAQMIVFHAKDDYFDDKRVLLACLDRVSEAAKLGGVNAMAMLGQVYCKSGQHDRGVPMLCEAVEDQRSFPVSCAVCLAHGGLSKNEYPTILGDMVTTYKIAEEAFARGGRHSCVLNWTVRSCLFPRNDDVRKHAMAEPIIHELKKIPRWRHCALEYLGRLHCVAEEEEYYNAELAEAIFIYNSAFHYSYPRSVAELHFLVPESMRDYVKCYAVYKRYEADGWNRDLKRLKVCAEKLNEEQLARADSLIRRDYPLSDEFRRPAYEYLIENGVIDGTWPYEKVE